MERRFSLAELMASPAHREQIVYHDLCRKAAALGVPTSLDDPKSPKTVKGLEDAVAAAEASR